ncbi:MAG: hypothetical protein ACREQJ_11130 [Candidatus Binatia bacterium]
MKVLGRIVAALVVAAALGAIALSSDTVVYALLRWTAAPPALDFTARVLPAPERGYTLTFDGFPPSPLCDVWINARKQNHLLREPGSAHAGTYGIDAGRAIHTVGPDADFDGYNNVVLFCALPQPKPGETLVVEMPMAITNLAGSTGFYVERPVIDARGEINPGGFQAVGLSIGGKDVGARIGRGAHLHEVWGWSTIRGVALATDDFSGAYRLELAVASTKEQTATLFRNGERVGSLALDHPLAGDLELQVWLDNYKVPWTYFPFGFGNVDPPETLELPEITVSIASAKPAE